MEAKDVDVEIGKSCEKCGWVGDTIKHSVQHRPSKHLYCYGGDPVLAPEAMVFICARCGYEWEIEE